MVDYFNAMDPELYKGEGPVDLGIQDIGMSVPMGISAGNVQGVYSKIRMGAGNIELQFPGAIRGQRQAHTPGMYGEDQRQAIRELGAVNEVKFTTHSSMGIMGLAGFTGDNPYNVWFQREQRKQAVDEIKRAIEFARDTAGGGSVVVHTGEVDRPLSEQPWNIGPDGRPLFKGYEEEAEVTRVRVVDERSGQVHQVRKNQRVARPKWLTSDKDYDGQDTKGNSVHIKKGDYVDYEGKLIPFEDWFNPEKGRVPIYDKERGRFENELYDWDMIMEETRKRNQWKAKILGKKVEDLTDEERYVPEEIYLRSTMETNEGHSRGWAMQYGYETDHHLKSLKKLREAMDYYEKLEKTIPEDEKWKIMRRNPMFGDAINQLVPPDAEMPTKILKEAITMQERRIEFSRQASASQELQAEDSHETQEYLVSADKYAVRESTKSYAEAGIHAMDCTINPRNPVVITMENIFPERYGGHPEELRNLIHKAREEMVNRLSHRTIEDPAGRRYTREEAQQLGRPDLYGKIRHIQNPYFRNMNEEEARKKAAQHIKATLDTGHLNTWRKYWQDDPQRTPLENEQAFKKWMLGQVETLAKEGLIGNVHLTDNFGYQDDHVAPGQGNTPNKEIVRILKKHGYDRAWTVEPGADASTDLSDFHGLMKTWRHFGSPIYGTGMRIGAPQTWTDVHYSYFGQNKPPYYIFGAYAPSNDWTLWSATPME
ncbi:sugar phosphate isomerase/epimerase [Candidatus Woesearchaeota archaeon]|nr:sugar phosphate isomerase/epimerase [Candidatus Woesearchaeota archaeon]